MADNDTPAKYAKYDIAIVEEVVLVSASELHPKHLSLDELSRRIVSNPKDKREVETVVRAIGNLREFGLMKDLDDETVELTTAALRAVRLFT